MALAVWMADVLGANRVKPRKPVFRIMKNDSVVVGFVVALKNGTETALRADCTPAREALFVGTVSAKDCGMTRTWSTVLMVTLPKVVVFVTVLSFLEED